MGERRTTYLGALLLLVLLGFIFVGATGQKQTGWYNIEPSRKVSENLGAVLGDVESRMPRGHIYTDSDQITWTHETTHGLNSKWRQYFQGKACLYVLKGRLCVLTHPQMTLNQIAGKVPASLRGNGYNLYLRQQTQYWNNEPLYVLDEWVSYTNGVAAILDLEEKGLLRRGDRSYGHDLEKMVQFTNYALVLTQLEGGKDPELTTFIRWHCERARALLLKAQGSKVINPSFAKETLGRLRQSPDGANLRAFCRSHFGKEWCKSILGVQ